MGLSPEAWAKLKAIKGPSWRVSVIGEPSICPVCRGPVKRRKENAWDKHGTLQIYCSNRCRKARHNKKGLF